MIGFPVLGFAFPALAQYIPIIGGIFERIEFDYEDLSRLQEFSNEVNITGEVNGMSITIEESVFDGQTVYFSYVVESDRALGGNFQFGINDLGLRVDGVEVHDNGWSGFPGALQQVSENTYIAVGYVSFPDFHEHLENAEVHFRLGGWNVAFPIERMESEILLVDELIEADGFEVTITQAVFLPIGTTLHFSYEMPSDYLRVDWDFLVYSTESERSEAEIAFRIRDDLGNEYTQWSMMSSHDDHNGSGWIQFEEALHPEASGLIITPYMNVHHWQLGDWEFSGEGSIGAEEVIAGGGNVESSEVILGDIVIQIP
jgi:hypothetical protein